MLVLVFYVVFEQMLVYDKVLAKTNLASMRKIIYLDHGPYGPQGPWAQPLFEPVADFLFFAGSWASQESKMRYFMNIIVCLRFVATLANVDLNLRLQICKIAI